MVVAVGCPPFDGVKINDERRCFDGKQARCQEKRVGRMGRSARGRPTRCRARRDEGASTRTSPGRSTPRRRRRGARRQRRRQDRAIEQGRRTGRRSCAAPTSCLSQPNPKARSQTHCGSSVAPAQQSAALRHVSASGAEHAEDRCMDGARRAAADLARAEDRPAATGAFHAIANLPDGHLGRMWDEHPSRPLPNLTSSTRNLRLQAFRNGRYWLEGCETWLIRVEFRRELRTLAYAAGMPPTASRDLQLATPALRRSRPPQHAPSAAT